MRSGELLGFQPLTRVSCAAATKLPAPDCRPERKGEKMPLFIVFLLSTFVFVCKASPSRSVFTNHWAVRLKGGSEEADKLASKYGFTNLGQVRVF